VNVKLWHSDSEWNVGQTRYERSGVVHRVLSRRGQGGRAGVRDLEKADAHEEGARTQHLDEH
jgi:hypothetical protein